MFKDWYIQYKKSLFIFLSCTVCLLGLFLYRGYVSPRQDILQKSQLVQETQSENIVVEKIFYQSNTENIRFVVPDKWEMSTTSVTLPIGFETPKFSLYKKDVGCIISVAEIAPDTDTTRKQVSFGDRILSSYSQFDSNWFAPITNTTSQYVFSGNKRQFIPGEFRLSYNMRNSPFVLFMNDGSSVLEECNNDLNMLLDTVEPYYEVVKLNATLDGVIIFDRVWDDQKNGVLDKSYELLLFVDAESKEKREVMKVPSGTWGGSFSISDDKMYIASNVYTVKDNGGFQFNSSLYMLDPFTGQVTEISGTKKNDSYISSVYVRNATVYYLLGTSELGECLNGYAPCPADLYSIPVAGGNPVLVGHSSIGRSILGYIDREKAFYIEQGNGDAGCMRTSMNKIVDGKEEIIGGTSGCFDEQVNGFVFDNSQMEKRIRALKDTLSTSRSCDYSVRVQEGSLRPASSKSTTYGSFCFTK